jgi:hypothetical protein
MKITNMSDYDRYIILADSSGKYHPDYQSFLNFNRIQKALSKIGSSQSSNYLYKDDIYDKPITSSEARQILQNFNEFKYEKVNDLVRRVANQLGLTFIAPTRKFTGKQGK